MANEFQVRQSATAFSSRLNTSQMGRMLNSTINLVYPQVCYLCGTCAARDGQPFSAPGLCEACVNELILGEPACSQCARPLPIGVNKELTKCPSCRSKGFQFEQAIALGVYDRALREAVLKMKQSTGELLALSLGRLLAERLADRLAMRPDCIVPVPTHWSRRIGRNLNCAELIAESVSAELKISSKPGLLRCRRRMQKQGTLLPTERQKNVHGAYAVSRGCDLQKQHVLVSDDVMTTGATAGELAKVLRKVGATGVTIAIIARGIGFDD